MNELIYFVQQWITQKNEKMTFLTGMKIKIDHGYLLKTLFNPSYGEVIVCLSPIWALKKKKKKKNVTQVVQFITTHSHSCLLIADYYKAQMLRNSAAALS